MSTDQADVPTKGTTLILPADLARRIAILAAEQGVRPCVFHRRWVAEGYQRHIEAAAVAGGVTDESSCPLTPR